MNRFRITAAVLAALVASASTMALAQATPADPAAPAAESKTPAAESKKPASAKKAPPKKTATKPAKKDTAPTAAPAKAAPKQPSKTYSTGPTTLRDKDGNVIPTSPEAYNVDSARKK
jgi:hypothetical protein